MNIAKKIVKYFLIPTLSITSVLIICLLLFMNLLYASGVLTFGKPAITLGGALLSLLLSALLSACNLIFRIKKLSAIPKILLHYFATVLSVFVVSLFTDYSFRRETILLVVVFSAVYFIVVPLSMLVYNIIKRRKSEEKTYEKLF